MPVVKDLRKGTFLYVFQHNGKTIWKNSFRSEYECEEAELKKKMELGVCSPLDYVKSSVYEAANRIDLLFPALSKKLIKSYEILTKEKFVPDHLKGFFKS